MVLIGLDDLCKYTSGMSFVYPKFSYDSHLKRMTEDVSKTLLRPAAYDCIAKVRCGNGLQTDLTFGHFNKLESGDLKFASLSSEQTFATTFIYDSKLSENDKIGIQCAVLYTTAEGQARIRIHNISLPCTLDISNVFKMADLDCLVSLLSKQVAGQYQEQPIPFIASQLSSKSIHVLAGYRKHCASSMSTGKLVLPDSLKLLPLYASCLLKLPGFQTSIWRFLSK